MWNLKNKADKTLQMQINQFFGFLNFLFLSLLVLRKFTQQMLWSDIVSLPITLSHHVINQSEAKCSREIKWWITVVKLHVLPCSWKSFNLQHKVVTKKFLKQGSCIECSWQFWTLLSDMATMCSSRKYPYSPHRRDWNFLGGWGFCKDKKIFKEMYED